MPIILPRVWIALLRPSVWRGWLSNNDRLIVWMRLIVAQIKIIATNRWILIRLPVIFFPHSEGFGIFTKLLEVSIILSWTWIFFFGPSIWHCVRLDVSRSILKFGDGFSSFKIIATNWGIGIRFPVIFLTHSDWLDILTEWF